MIGETDLFLWRLIGGNLVNLFLWRLVGGNLVDLFLGRLVGGNLVGGNLVGVWGVPLVRVGTWLVVLGFDYCGGLVG